MRQHSGRPIVQLRFPLPKVGIVHPSPIESVSGTINLAEGIPAGQALASKPLRVASVKKLVQAMADIAPITANLGISLKDLPAPDREHLARFLDGLSAKK